MLNIPVIRKSSKTKYFKTYFAYISWDYPLVCGRQGRNFVGFCFGGCFFCINQKISDDKNDSFYLAINRADRYCKTRIVSGAGK